MDIICAGCCLYLFEHQPPPHLWVVLTNPTGQPPEVLTVMLTTRRAHTDDTVILQPRDHPFVQRETAVSYKTATYRRVSAILGKMKAGKCELRETIREPVLHRIRDGLLESPHTIHAIRRRFDS